MFYDLIVTGAGLGGLSFIHHLINSEVSFRKVLVIDKDSKQTNDRTWSFWLTEAPGLKCAQRQSWNQLGFASDNLLRFDTIYPYAYYTIHGIDFYNEVMAQIRQHPNIDFVHEEVLAMEETGNRVSVLTENNTYTCRWVVDSISRPAIDANQNLLVYQNFLGNTIQVNEALFNPHKPILMDFRVPQYGAVSFVYILPYTETEALVEFTQFTNNKHIDMPFYQKALNSYITRQLKPKCFETLDLELGQIPMTDYEFDPQPSRRIFRIGTAGGDTKPTTGYTFRNVQAHCQAILTSIQHLPVNLPNKERFKFYDNLLLQIIKEQPEKVKAIMTYLFKNQPMARVLKFLDEETNLLEEALIMGLLPWKPFLQTLLKPKRYDFAQ